MKVKKGNKRIVNTAADVSSLLPIAEIDSGIIKTTDGRYLKIFEVLPINFNMRSEDERYAVVQNFHGTINYIKSKVQFKIISQKTNTAEHEASIIDAERMDSTHPQRRLLQEYLRFVRELGHVTSISRKFYVVLEYVPTSESAPGFEGAFEGLTSDSQILAAAFGFCGNECKNPISGVDANWETLENLYNILNPRSSMVEPFVERFIRVRDDSVNSSSDGSHTKLDLPRLLCPRGVQFKSSYSVIDGEYVSYLYIKSKGYPSAYVPTGWAGSFMNLGEGVTYDIFLEKLPREDVQNKLFLLKRSEAANNIDKSLNDYNTSEVLFKMYSQDYIYEQLQQNTDLFNMHILFTVHAPTLKALKLKMRTCRTQLRNLGFIADEATMLQKEAYLSVLPLLKLSPLLAQPSRRNITTRGLAGSFPFSAFEMCDNDGVLTGLNAHNESLLIQNIFSKDYANANMLICGASGAGKSFLLQMLAGRYRLRQHDVYVILPEKGKEFKKGVLAHGGEYIQLYAGSKDCINIMDIATYDTSVVLENEDGADSDSDGSLMTEKVNQITTWFYLIRPKMTEEEAQKLQLAIINTYAAFDITVDNESIIDPATGGLREMPTLRDLYYTLNADNDTISLATSLSPYAIGAARNMGQATNVSLDNKYIVFDISRASDKELAPFMFIALDFIWAKCRQDRTKNKILILDELWKLMNLNDDVAKFVLKIFKIIRGYGGGAWAATQDISDFFMYDGGRLSKGIVAAARTKILLKFEEEESKQVQSVLGLTNSERRLLSTMNLPGEGLICCNNNKIHFYGKATPYEIGLYSSTASEIREIEKAEEEERKSNSFNEDETLDNIMNTSLPGSESQFN